MSIYRLKTTWSSTTPGFPGYTFMYFTSNNCPPSQVAIFWDSIKVNFPGPLKWDVDPTVVEIDETNGKMTNAIPAPQPATVVATGATAYVAQAGAQVKLYTNGIVNGRKVRGRWFMVPCLSANFVAGGVLSPTFCNAVNAAVDALRSASGQTLCVWSRPLFEKDANGHPTDVIKRPGSFHAVTSSAVPTKSVTLNSRRDN